MKTNTTTSTNDATTSMPASASAVLTEAEIAAVAGGNSALFAMTQTIMGGAIPTKPN